MDPKNGGTLTMSFRNFSTGNDNPFGSEYLEMVAGSLLRYRDQFDDPAMPEVMTVNFRQVICGTELRVTQDGIPEMIPVEMCYLGWQESLM